MFFSALLTDGFLDQQKCFFSLDIADKLMFG
jgi:hypothetical protein